MKLELDGSVVRSWRPDDAESLVRHADDRAVWLQLRDRFPHPYTPRHARRFLDQVVRLDPEL
ncbi:MAG: GNAT family N-acetyltransferase, partial [Gemmatimonadetes bacterium]|nr:GNAT family N-acetyltransferase [Gemmatimonadota bacterium]NIY37937.1 GNAT family N-acetyltransferase [Gemmatimonadota bacterium]